MHAVGVLSALGHYGLTRGTSSAASKNGMSAFDVPLGHYGLTRGTSKADIPFLLAALAGELSLPYTLIFLMPTNRRLMAIDECKQNGKPI